MQQCAIYDNKALNFFRASSGFLALAGFLFQNIWLVLATGILFLLGAFSMKLNFIYQIYKFFAKNVLKEQFSPIEKDPGEIKFVYGFTAVMFLASFGLLYFEKFTAFAWGLDLLVSFLTLLASFANICAAALMYAVFKKIFVK